MLPGLFTLKIGTAAKRSTYSCCRGVFKGRESREDESQLMQISP